MRLSSKIKNEIANIIKRNNYTLRNIRCKNSFSNIAVFETVRKLSIEEIFSIRSPLSVKGTTTGACLKCGKDTNFDSYTHGYRKYCSHICHSSDMSSDTKKKRASSVKTTMIERYGVPVPMQIESVKNKMHATMTERYGVHATMLRKDYLDSFVSPFANKEVQEKITKTMTERYGYRGAISEEAMKRRVSTFKNTLRADPGRWKNSHYQRKEITVKGYTFSVQGYEDKVLRYLVSKKKVDPSTITINPIAVDYLDTAGKERIYIPDMKVRVKGRWWIVEVKSNYTAGLGNANRTMFYNMRRKSKAVADSGRRIMTILWHEGKFVCLQNVHNLSRREVMARVYG